MPPKRKRPYTEFEDLGKPELDTPVSTEQVFTTEWSMHSTGIARKDYGASTLSSSEPASPYVSFTNDEALDAMDISANWSLNPPQVSETGTTAPEELGDTEVRRKREPTSIDRSKPFFAEKTHSPSANE
jgi:hypothetical protein